MVSDMLYALEDFPTFQATEFISWHRALSSSLDIVYVYVIG